MSTETSNSVEGSAEPLRQLRLRIATSGVRLADAKDVVSFAVVLAVFLVAELWIGARVFSINLFMFALVFAIVQTVAGSLAISAGAMQDIKARLPAAFCVGFACITLPMYALTSLLSISAFSALAICAFVVLLMSLLRRSWAGARAITSPPLASGDIAITLVMAVAVAVLTRTPVASARILELTSALPLWSDFFLHGVTISSFGGPFSNGTDMEVIGIGRVFYHYAPFMLPAAFQPVAGMSGLALGASMLLPLSLLTAALGCYVFAAQLGGRAVGLLATVVACVVPLYRIPMQSGMLDFHWMFLAAPGSGYAIGLALVACVAAMLYIQHGGVRRFCFLALLLLSIILVRVHFFMLVAPAVVMHVGLSRRGPGYKVIAVLGLLVLVLATIAWASPQFQAWYASLPAPSGYLDTVLTQTLLFGHPLAMHAYPVGMVLLVKTGLTLVALLGVYALAYPALAALAAMRGRAQGADGLALFLLITYVVLMLFAPTASNGDSTEFRHRHFPLVYLMVALLSVIHASRLLMESGQTPAWRERATVTLAVAVLCVATLATRGENPAAPDSKSMPWSVDFFGQRVAPGLVDASRFMRAHAQRGDILAAGGNAASGFSPMIVDLISMTDIPAFLARSELRMLREPCIQRTVVMRSDALTQISVAKDWPEARQRMRDNAIRWFLVPQGDPAAWDPGRQAAAYTSNGLSVYDAGLRAEGVLPPTAPCKPAAKAE